MGIFMIMFVEFKVNVSNNEKNEYFTMLGFF